MELHLYALFQKTLYSDFLLNTKSSHDEFIRKRNAEGEGLSELAPTYGISSQRVNQIVHYKQK